jgi:protoheme IX farnesyltransferase
MAVMSTVAQPVVAEDVALVSLKTRLADYVELSKPKIAAMALVTVGVGFLLGATPGLAMVQPLLHTLVGAAVVAAGGSALNHWLERRADAKMYRTANRPLVTGRLHHTEALVFGVTLGLLGVGYLWFALPSPAAAIAAAATAVLYVGVYTPLKRFTSWNTVVGAIPGALPPVIGYCGATGGMDLPGWALFAILFVWQLPHFYSIAFMHRDDYARGGMVMLPNVDHADGRVTGWATFATALLLVPVTVLPGFLFEGAWRWVYLAGSLPVAVWFLVRCVRFARHRTTPTARSVLRGSLVYLLAVMALFVAAGVVPRYFS